MYNKIDLKNKLESIHRKSYPAYKSLRGSYTFGDFVLSIDMCREILLRHHLRCM